MWLKETAYMFRTLLGDTVFFIYIILKAFNSGVHYWELTADERTENELKIGNYSKNNKNKVFPLNWISIIIRHFVISSSGSHIMV